MVTPRDAWVRADFNGLFGDLLCLAHSELVVDVSGRTVKLVAGQVVTAFDDDADEHGRPDRILATGAVVESPADLGHTGSKWCLQLDPSGVQWESDLS